MMTPSTYQRYLDLKAEIRKLQDELGITPLTMEQRYKILHDKLQREEEQRKEKIRIQAELAKLGPRRTPRVPIGRIGK